MDERARPAIIFEVDAISVCNTFIGMSSVTQEKEGYVFLLNLQPIFPELHCIPIHVLGFETGNTNKSVQRRIDEVVACLREARIFVFGIASDGDPSDNPRHEKFFNFWSIAEKYEGLDVSLAHIQSYQEPFPIADLLYFAKKLALTYDQKVIAPPLSRKA
jgi:hypothetical protein